MKGLILFGVIGKVDELSFDFAQFSANSSAGLLIGTQS
jgi:hypothetical protein